jgi:CDP-glycerol glycerophosphotransferase
MLVNRQEYQKKYVAFYDKYCAWEDGHASQKVAEAVFKLKGDLNETNH